MMWFDRRLFQLLHRRAGELPLVDPLLLGCARFGSHGEVTLMLLAGLFGGRRGRAALPRCLLAVAAIYAVAEVIGRFVGRPRPFAADAAARVLIEHSPERSFPSRHVASGVAMAVIVRAANRPLGDAMGALAAAIGLGRTRAGLHYPSDVVVGAGLGAGLGYIIGAGLRQPGRRRRPAGTAGSPPRQAPS